MSDDWSVFHEFVAASGLAVERGSVRVFEPPLPHFSAIVDGQRRYFELIRIATESADTDAPRDPTAAIVAALGQPVETRQTLGDPVELVIVGDGTVRPESRERVLSVLEEQVAAGGGRWARIWLWDALADVPLCAPRPG